MRDIIDFNHKNLVNDFIGFDNLFKVLSDSVNVETSTFPPFDLYKEQVRFGGKVEEHTFLKYALAGLSKENLKVELSPENILTVYNDKVSGSEKRQYIHKGIAARQFRISKTISKELELVQCSFEEGCLIIEFRTKDKIKKETQFIKIQ